MEGFDFGVNVVNDTIGASPAAVVEVAAGAPVGDIQVAGDGGGEAPAAIQEVSGAPGEIAIPPADIAEAPVVPWYEKVGAAPESVSRFGLNQFPDAESYFAAASQAARDAEQGRMFMEMVTPFFQAGETGKGTAGTAGSQGEEEDPFAAFAQLDERLPGMMKTAVEKTIGKRFAPIEQERENARLHGEWERVMPPREEIAKYAEAIDNRLMAQGITTREQRLRNPQACRNAYLEAKVEALEKGVVPAAREQGRREAAASDAQARGLAGGSQAGGAGAPVKPLSVEAQIAESIGAAGPQRDPVFGVNVVRR